VNIKVNAASTTMVVRCSIHQDREARTFFLGTLLWPFLPTKAITPSFLQPFVWWTSLTSRGLMRAVIVGFTGGVVLTLLSLARVEYFPWPDFVHWRHGFPILWLTHQTSSIAGPVDRWFIDPGALIADFLFWILLTFFVYSVYRYRPHTPNAST